MGVVAPEASGRKQVDVTRYHRPQEEEAASLSASAAGLIRAGPTAGGRLVRSARLAEAGAAVLCASYIALFVVMPRFTPFQLLNCTPIAPTQSFPEGGTSCFTSLNTAYPLVFLVSVAGTVTLLFGLLGRGFVVSPVSVIGMIALEWGLAGVVSASLNTESGVATNPVIFAPFVALGALVLCFQANRRLRPQTSPAGRFYPITNSIRMPKEIPKEIPPELYEVYRVPMGVMSFFPPKRCNNCDD